MRRLSCGGGRKSRTWRPWPGRTGDRVGGERRAGISAAAGRRENGVERVTRSETSGTSAQVSPLSHHLPACAHTVKGTRTGSPPDPRRTPAARSLPHAPASMFLSFLLSPSCRSPVSLRRRGNAIWVAGHLCHVEFIIVAALVFVIVSKRSPALSPCAK